MNIALVDADSLYFRICYKTKKQNDIRKFIRGEILKIDAATMADRLHIAVKGPNNFRHELYDKYKANRPALEPDMKKALTYAHEYIIGEFGAIPSEGMEADDLVSIWAYECAAAGHDYVVCGIDKDLKQIPGTHYNFVKEEYEQIDTAEGHLRLMAQSLTGDSTDGIPGIKGIGPKKAEKILQGLRPEARWNAVVNAWADHSAGRPDLSYNLLRMLTSWDEYEDIRAYLSGKPSDGESDERPLPGQGSESFQIISRISERDSGRADGEGMAVRSEPSVDSSALRSEQPSEGSGQPEQTSA